MPARRSRTEPPPPLTEAKGYTRALRWLGARAMSTAAVGRRLRRAGADEAVAQAIVQRLVAERWLDDAVFATAVARRGFADRGWSPRRVRLALVRAGIVGSVAESAIAAAEAESPGAGEARLQRLAERKWAALVAKGGLEPRARRQRFVAWLARRGVSGDVIRRLTAEVAGR